MSAQVSWDELLADGYRWLFRGVFLRSPADEWLRDLDEIVPPRPDRRGSQWREVHSNGDTETAYTSWSTDWETSKIFGEEAREDAQASGEVVVFRVRTESLINRGFYGRDNEYEILIEGTVEGVEVSTGLEEEEQDE